ncbi:testis-specific gene 10 protein-like isoform X2 [Anguilla rostrata]
MDSFPARISYQSRQNTDNLQEKNWSLEKEKVYGQDLVQNGGKTTREQTSNGFVKQLSIKEMMSSMSQQSVEMEGDEVMTKLRRLTAERDSLREHLKTSQAFQERTLSERMYLIKRVEDLQGTILRKVVVSVETPGGECYSLPHCFQLDQEHSDYTSKQSAMEEHMLSLEGQVHTLDRKLNATEEDLKKAKAECSSLRQLKTKAENSFSDRQRNLMAIIRELQNVEERKKQLEERNESLSKQVSCLTEDARSLHSAVFQLNQDKDFQRKQLDDKEKTIVNLKLKVEQQATATESLQQVLRGRDQELEAMRRNLTEAVENLNTAMREKEGILQTNSQLRDNLDKAYLDQKALQRIVEGSSQEMEALQKRLQEYISESSNKNKIMVSKDKVIERLQLMVEDLGETTESLQQGMDRGEEEMEAVQRKLMDTEETLDKVLKEKKSMLEVNDQLRDNLNKAQLDIQALQSMIEESNQELEELRGKLRDYIMNMSCLEEQLSYKDKVIDSMQMTVEEQDEITKSMQQAINRGQQDLAAVERNLSDLEEKLDFVINEKEAMLLENIEVRGNLDKASSDAQASETVKVSKFV